MKRLLPVLALLAQAPALSANPWAQVDGPSPGPSRAIGETSAGCISGAKRLPLDGRGYAVMHLERNRYFGHSVLVDAIQDFGERAARGLGVLHVGDLGMARGGPMPFGHRSHQSGLDADVWFDLNPGLLDRANSSRSNVSAFSLLTSAAAGLNYRLWNHSHEEILKTVATNGAVDRIFVNPHIKRELCDSVSGDRSWLRKVRPWYHHDDHFHLRLTCPADSPECVRQEPIPPGDGCDGLDWWFHRRQPETDAPVAPPPPPKPKMPSACYSVLDE